MLLHTLQRRPRQTLHQDSAMERMPILVYHRQSIRDREGQAEDLVETGFLCRCVGAVDGFEPGAGANGDPVGAVAHDVSCLLFSFGRWVEIGGMGNEWKWKERGKGPYFWWRR